MNLGWLIGITIIYTLVLVAIGWYGYRSTKATVADYFVAAGSVGTFAIFFTLYATLLSAWTFLGLAGSGFSHGLGWAIVVPIEGLAWAWAIWYWGSRFWVLGRKNGYVTPADLMADRYESQAVRLLVALVTLVGLVPQVSVQISGIGLTYAALSGGKISFLGGTVFFLFFLALYTIAGGFRAVAWTDAVQGMVLFVFMWVGLFMILSHPDIGGMSGIISKLDAKNSPLLGLPGGGNFWGFKNWIAWLSILIMGVLAYPMLIVRFYAARSLTTLRTTASIIPIFALLGYFPAVMVGIMASVMMPELKPVDMAMPMMLMKYTGPVVASVLSLGAIAAAMSTVDSILLVQGSVVTRDIIERYLGLKMSQQELMKWSRWSVGAWVLVCFAIGVWNPTIIVIMSGFALRMIGAGLFIPIMAAMFWPRSNKQGIIASIIVGELVTVSLTFVTAWKNPLGWDSIIWGGAAGLIALVVGTYLFPAPSKAIVKRFYDDVVTDINATLAAERNGARVQTQPGAAAGD